MFAVGRYTSSGLTLSHYDAKAHLVVARRILDSLTPGWEQIGAVWLPLPHLINMLPVQIDHLYRTGGFAIAVSVLAHGLTVASMTATVLLLTGSVAGAALTAALVSLNPDVLYLQATPMTEPLLFGLTACEVLLLTAWGVRGRLDDTPRAAGWVMVLACLTRYEAWAITGVALALSALAWWRQGASPVGVLKAHARLAVYPLATFAAFMVFSRMTVGEWFVSGGFFVPDETLRGQPAVVTKKIVEGATALGGVWLVRAAEISVVVVAGVALVRRQRAALLVPLALFGAVALPVTAYLAGHPFRIRYEIPLVVAGALAIGLCVGLLRRAAMPVALIVLALVVYDRPPFDPRAPMISEAQLDRPNARRRTRVTACLQSRYDGGTIMVSMGSLGHYMHELASAGFEIRYFLHEGNGPIWDSAFTRGPAPLVRWVLVEEQAEGGDAVIRRQRAFPRLLEDFERVCSGGNVSLYRRR